VEAVTSEDDDFARMLADNNNTTSSQVLRPNAPALIQQQSSEASQQARVASSGAHVLARSRSMYETFAGGGVRPLGLLSGLTNQRVPDTTAMRR
jgi:hypothetical protein